MYLSTDKFKVKIMKGKKLEIVVLVISFAILAIALFLMFKGRGTPDEVKTVMLVNRLFSLGFLVYIAYSYLLSTNLNNEILNLNQHVDNLKQETARLNKTINKQKTEIADQQSRISDLESENKTVSDEKDALIKQLAKANQQLEKLERAYD